MKSFSTLLLGLILYQNVLATTHLVYVSYPSFSPSGLSVTIGDTIFWKGDLSKFPIASLSVPENAQAFNVNDGTTFSYVVKVTGTYKYQCEEYKNAGMSGYFIALEPEKGTENNDGSMVYINYYSHAFHLVTTDAIPHSNYTVTIATATGKEVYKSMLNSTEKDKWVATTEFLPGTYMLTVTDGTHSFGRKFTK